jgi:hypothetical protein
MMQYGMGPTTAYELSQAFLRFLRPGLDASSVVKLRQRAEGSICCEARRVLQPIGRCTGWVCRRLHDARGAVILPLFLLRPLDHPLDQLRVDSPAKPRRIIELVAQVDVQAQCLGLRRKRLDKLIQRKPLSTVVFAIGILVLPAIDVPEPELNSSRPHQCA